MSGMRRAALVLAGVALLVAGCAGGDDAPADAPADIPSTMTEMSGMPTEMIDNDDMPTSTPTPE